MCVKMVQNDLQHESSLPIGQFLSWKVRTQYKMFARACEMKVFFIMTVHLVPFATSKKIQSKLVVSR